MISKNPIENFNKKFDVVSVFIDVAGKTLFLLRQDHKPQGNKWAMVAGKVDSSENFINALVREVREEIGLETSPEQYKHFDSYYIRYPVYDYTYHVYHLPLEVLPELNINTDEHKDHVWIEPNNALKLDLIQYEDFCIKSFYGIT
jgi:(d)CTP diphosphatase